MSARERILAAVEFVRSGQGGYEQCAKHFRMTIDVVRKACAAAGVADIAPPPLPNGAPLKNPFSWKKSMPHIPNGARATERDDARMFRNRERWVEKRVTKSMVKD